MPFALAFDRWPRSIAQASLIAGLLCSPWIAQAQPAIYRCGNTYSHAACPGAQPIADPLSVLHDSTQAPPGQQTVYLCQSQGGSQFWSNLHCNQRQATIERMETVPANLPWTQQVQHAQQQMQQAQQHSTAALHSERDPALARAQARRSATAARAAHRASQPPNNTAACQQVQARIAQLDAQGRAGGAMAALDQLRDARRAARAQYRSLGC